MDSSDNQLSTDQNSARSNKEGKGPWHCLTCPSERKPIKQRRHHKCKGEYVACTGDQTCERCKLGQEQSKGANRKHRVLKCPYCLKRKRTDKMTAHIKVCGKKLKDGEPSQAPQSLNDSDSYRADDTESQLSQFNNSSSEEEEIGQKRAPSVRVEELEQAAKKPPVPLFHKGVVPIKPEERLGSLTERLFKQAEEQRDAQEQHIIQTAQQLEAENEQYLNQLAQRRIDRMSSQFHTRSQVLTQGLKNFKKAIQVKEEQQYARDTFGDCEESAVEKAFQFIGKGLWPPKYGIEVKLRLWQDFTRLFMGSVNLDPNKIQMAIALSVAFWTIAPGQKGTLKNQMIVVPAAKGKTRISMATALCLMKKQANTDKVVVVFSSDLLMKQDEQTWLKAEEVFTSSGASLKRVVGLREATDASDKNTVILIDEADKLLIDDLGRAPTKCRACIGFTATIPNHEQESCFEARWLKHLNFGIKSSFGYEQKEKTIDFEVPDIGAFFTESRAASKLVWCNQTEDDINAIIDEAEKKGFECHVDCEDLSIIRNMEERCLIVTKQDLMRGVDYRLAGTTGKPSDGIDLLVMRSFSSQRAAEQGLSRVGRYNEPCARYKLKKVELIDKRVEAELNMKISQICK